MRIFERLRDMATADERAISPGCPTAHLYGAIDEYAMEIEALEALHSLVRATKPAWAIESGAGRGISTSVILDALEMNRFGALWSFEPEVRFQEVARMAVGEHPCFVDLLDKPTHLLEQSYDFVLLDSGPEYREKEIAHWLEKRTFLVVHDAYRYDVLRGAGGFCLNTPRGLWFRDRRERM